MELHRSSDTVAAADTPSHQTSSQSPSPDLAGTFQEACLEANVHGLCQTCDKVVAWFFLKPTKQAIDTGKKSGHLCKIHLAAGSEACHLCQFLTSLTSAYQNSEWAMTYQKLRTGPYELFAWETNLTFYPAGRTEMDNAMMFYVAPHNAIRASDALQYNGCFIPLKPRPNGLSAHLLNPRFDITALKEWIQVCERRHPTCAHFSSGQALPGLKVIDCDSQKIVEIQQWLPYVTLSYLWGKELAVLSSNPDQLPSQLPQLIQDVMHVTSTLGYRYLWIDRYCVPQNNGPIKDTLINNMDVIYSKSVLTIIASATESPAHGLTGVSCDRTRVQEVLKLNELSLVQMITDTRAEVLASRWHTRGWTYQEGVLARRRIVFTESQCYFQCANMCRVESISIPGDNGLDMPNLPKVFPPQGPGGVDDYGNSEGSWGLRERLQEYSKKQLSHDNDALNAFKGVLNSFTALEDFHGHLSGIPLWHRDSLETGFKESLLCGLTWSRYLPGTQSDHRVHHATSYSDSELANFPERRACFPSWSWCGWKFSSSPYNISWETDVLFTLASQTSEDNHQNTLRTLTDMIVDTEISVEFHGKEVIKWSASNAAELVKKSMSTHKVQALLIRGWFSELEIPCLNSGLGASQTPYNVNDDDIERLGLLAAMLGSPTANGRYSLNIWVVAPLPSLVGRGQVFNDVFLMVLLPTSDPDTFERLDLIQVGLRDKKLGNLSLFSLSEIAQRLNWRMRNLRLV